MYCNTEGRQRIRDAAFYAGIEAAKRQIRSKAAKHLTDVLVRRGPTNSAELAREAGVCNLSDAAAKIRPELEKHGLTIVARRPPTRLRNRFGEPSDMHIWSIEVIR